MNPLLAPELRAIKNMQIKPNRSACPRSTEWTGISSRRCTVAWIPRLRKGRQSPPAWAPLGRRRPTCCPISPFRSWQPTGTSRSCSYSNFKALRPEKRAEARRLRRHPHPLYETGPGEQMQCDWVEGLSIVFRDGTEFAFNLFSTTLVFSRLHYFELAEPAAEPLGVSKEKKDE